jgi:hypothetical protein
MCGAACADASGRMRTMGSYKKNSEWEERTHELLTDRGRLCESLGDLEAFAGFMNRYRPAVEAYLHAFLLRNKLVVDEKSASDAVRLLWSWLTDHLPPKVAAQWKSGESSFRDLLCEGMHDAYHSWAKPATRTLMMTSHDNADLNRRIRDLLLQQARDKLKAYARENESRGTLYFKLFTMREAHLGEDLESLRIRFAKLPGARELSAVNFRKTLSRARDLFAKFLFDDAEAALVAGNLTSRDDFLKVLEELDLWEKYLSKSKYCRWMLGMQHKDSD